MRNALFARVGLLLALVPLAAGGSEQSNSLKDAARRQGGKVSDYLQVEMPFASLSQVVSAADVIVCFESAASRWMKRTRRATVSSESLGLRSKRRSTARQRNAPG